jgi:hypothetical protein
MLTAPPPFAKRQPLLCWALIKYEAVRDECKSQRDRLHQEVLDSDSRLVIRHEAPHRRTLSRQGSYLVSQLKYLASK